jgi:outer membrane protein TolC
MRIKFMGISRAKFVYQTIGLLVVGASTAYAQDQSLDLSAAKTPLLQRGAGTQEPATPSVATSVQDTQNNVAPPNGTAPLRLTFKDALERARKNSPLFTAAETNAAVARADKIIARAALLPSVNYENTYTKTKAASAAAIAAGQPSVVFIANNAPDEYFSQGNAHEALDIAGYSAWRRASAASAVAKAQLEIAKRGLVFTLAQAYYKVSAAQFKLDIAQRTFAEGDNFFKLTQQLEGGGEVAHSDVIKAELQMRERQRQLQEAQLALLNAKLDLAVLIFPDFNLNYEIADDLHADVPLPPIEAVQQNAGRDNPDLLAALSSVQLAGFDVSGARAGYLPGLTLDYFYGIDADRLALHSTFGGQRVSNLGYSVVASLNIPVWNWGATQQKLRQAHLKQTQAKRELSMAQRKLLAETQSLYAEAKTALEELEGLRRSAELAAESLRLVNLRYKNGESTVLEVVDAQTTFSTANSAYQDGAVRYRVALASLQTLTGVLPNP